MKKRMYIIASICVALGILWTGMGSADANKVYAAEVVGDVDGSTVVDTADVTSMLTELVQGNAVDTANDTNVDSALDIKDLMRLQRYVTPADTTWLNEENKKTDSDGTEYYEITNFAELYGLSTVADCDKTIRLAKDFVLNADCAFKTSNDKVSGVYGGLVRQWTPIDNFTGTFDGQGHTVSGLYVLDTEQGVGFFDSAVAATIQDFRMTHSYIMSYAWYTGSIAGEFSGTMKNVYSDAYVRTTQTGIGGLVGGVTTTTGAAIENCWFDGTLQTSGLRVGGVIGTNDGSAATIDVKHCLVTGQLNSSKAANNPILGGFLGFINSANNATATVSDCLFAGNINCTGGKTYYLVGSVLGQLGTANNTSVILNIENTYGIETGYLDSVEHSDSTTHVYGVGVVTGVASTNIAGYAQEQSADSFTGINADANTDLDFVTTSDSVVPTWIVREGTYPILGSFADMATEELLYVNWYCDADGTASDPYVLDTAYDLSGFNYIANTNGENFSGMTVQLGADIVLNEGDAEEWGTTAPENVWTPITEFAGTFDGQNHTVSGVYVSETSSQYAGFFKQALGATIQDFRMKNSYISTSQWDVGSIAGNFSGTMKNVFSDAIVVNTTTGAGGLIGCVATSGGETIENCWFDGLLQTKGERAGGIAGRNAGSQTTITIKNCLVTGVLNSSRDNNSPKLGGFIGLVDSAKNATVNISGCLFAGEFNCTSGKTYYRVGEILGQVGTVNNQSVFVNLTDTYSVEMLGTTTYLNDAAGTDVTKVAGIGYEYGVANANITGAATVASADLFKGINADENTNLDFATTSDSEVPTWIVREGTYPILGCFADMATEELLYVNWYCDADGTASDPYVLDTAYDLYAFTDMAQDGVNFSGKTVQLGADISLNDSDAADWGTTAPKNVWTPVDKFYGTFDGQGHTISGIYVNGTNQQGLFRRVIGGTIKNLRLENSYISGSSYGVGSIAGRFSGILENVYSDATVVGQGDYAGGLVGVVEPLTGGSSIRECWFDGTINASKRYVGGIAGATTTASDGTSGATLNMSHCLVTGEFNTSYGDDRKAYLGGLLGSILVSGDDVTISDSLFTGVIRDVSTGVDTNGNPWSYRYVGDMLGHIAAGEVTLSSTYGSPRYYWQTTTNSWGHNGGSYAGSSSGCTAVDGIGMVWGVDASNITGSTTILSRENVVGENATTYTNLDFTTPIWVTVPNRTPVLKCFKGLVEESDITVMSYNIRSGNMVNPADPDYKLWENRKDYVIAGITASNPTILCLQEIDALESEDNVNRYDYLCNQLSPEGYVATKAVDATEYILPTQIFYKSELYTKLAEGYFELLASPTGEQRYCVYVVLQDKVTQNKFMVATSHWPADVDDTGRQECSIKIQTTLPTIMQENGVTSMMLMGDFNCTIGNTAVSDLATELDLLNCKNQTTNTVDVISLNNWGTPVNTIDHILISNKGFNVKYYNVDNTMYGDDKTLYASDHFPVIVGLDF